MKKFDKYNWRKGYLAADCLKLAEEINGKYLVEESELEWVSGARCIVNPDAWFWNAGRNDKHDTHRARIIKSSIQEIPKAQCEHKNIRSYCGLYHSDAFMVRCDDCNTPLKQTAWSVKE